MHGQSKCVEYIEVRGGGPSGSVAFDRCVSEPLRGSSAATPRSHQSLREKGMVFITDTLDSRCDLAV
jgi:hypothetical protein